VVAPSWEERRLCDDGACTGLIGNDGLCRVCGRAAPFWGDERRRGMHDEVDEPNDAPAATGDGAEDVDERRLCPDGSCTGVVDVDGRCKVCGKVDDSFRSARVRAAADDAAADGEDADQGDDAGVRDDEEKDDDERRLCPDGACTGLIGSDGACKVCGRRLED